MNYTIHYKKEILIINILNNIKKQKIFESLDESFIKAKINKIFKLFINIFIKNNNILYKIIINLKWSFYNKKNIIILYFQSYNDLNIFLTIKNELLNFICNEFDNPYIDINPIINLENKYKNIYNKFNNNFLILSKKNNYLIYLKEKLYLINIEV